MVFNNKFSISTASSSTSSLINTGDIYNNNKKNNGKDIEVIEPGLVLIRNFATEEECRRLAGTAIDMGQQGEDGFFTTDVVSGTKQLNTGEKRGRIYDAATRFPNHTIDHCHHAVKIARSVDDEMPVMDCTHVLLNMYTSSEGLVWHRDIYENDGKSNHPVVNLCVGASCIFAFKHNDDDPERRVTLRSGDVLLFGGPCRLIQHAVLDVLLDECPGWLTEMAGFPCRFSFTFRDSPEVLGREAEFKYFRVKDHLVGQDEFVVPTDPKEFRGLPSRQSQGAKMTTTATLIAAVNATVTISDPSCDLLLDDHNVKDEEKQRSN